MSDWKRLIATPALAIGGLVGSLALAEVALFLADLPRSYRAPDKEPHLELAEPDALRRQVGWTNARSNTRTFRYDGDPRGYFGPSGSVIHTTNSLGFRGAEFSRERAAGALRVATLGDSFTFGEGVHDRDTYSAQLERSLARTFPDRRVEVQNWGVGGYNTVQAAALFEELVLDHDPDVVVLGFTVNDAEPLLLTFDRTTGRVLRRAPGMELLTPVVVPEPRGWERLRLARLARSRVGNRESTRSVIDHHRELYSDESASWAECRTAIRRIGGICRGRNLGCFAVVFPLLWDLADYPLADVHRKLLYELGFAGFDTVDLLPELTGYEGPDLWVHPTDQHPNEAVHSLVARLLAGRIAESLQPGRGPAERRRDG